MENRKIYIFESNNKLKLGITTNVKRRSQEVKSRLKLSEINIIYQSEDVEYYEAWTIEDTYSKILREYSLGNEWFSCTVEQAIDAIERSIYTASVLVPTDPREVEVLPYNKFLSENHSELENIIKRGCALALGKFDIQWN